MMCRALALWVVLLVALPVSGARAGDEPETTPETTPEQASLTEVGDLAPAFSIKLLDGTVFDLEQQRGKVVLVNFWATWCPPCVAEIPHLRDEVFSRFRGEDFAMVCISREETPEVVLPFAKKKKASVLPLAIDTDRSIYRQYADHTIPRNYVIGPDGHILFQSIGFEEPDFEAMIAVIDTALSASAH